MSLQGPSSPLPARGPRLPGGGSCPWWPHRPQGQPAFRRACRCGLKGRPQACFAAALPAGQSGCCVPPSRRARRSPGGSIPGQFPRQGLRIDSRFAYSPGGGGRGRGIPLQGAERSAREPCPSRRQGGGSLHTSSRGPAPGGYLRGGLPSRASPARDLLGAGGEEGGEGIQDMPVRPGCRRGGMLRARADARRRPGGFQEYSIGLRRSIIAPSRGANPWGERKEASSLV